jgi:hypothetical protein
MLFAAPGGELNGDLRANRFDEDRAYTEVVISIQQDSGREPVETPTESDEILETPSG